MAAQGGGWRTDDQGHAGRPADRLQLLAQFQQPARTAYSTAAVKRLLLPPPSPSPSRPARPALCCMGGIQNGRGWEQSEAGAVRLAAAAAAWRCADRPSTGAGRSWSRRGSPRPPSLAGRVL